MKYFSFFIAGIMNSRQLQEKHGKVYEDFFQQHEIVLSCPFTSNWSGDVFSNYIGLGMRQKVPLRMYVGLSIGVSGCELGNITYYNIGDKLFVSEKVGNYASYLINIFEAIKKFHGETKVKIDILSECSDSLGLDFINIYTLLILISLSYSSKIFTQDMLNGWRKSHINELLHNNELPMKNIFLQALQVDKITHNKGSFTSKICAFFDGSHPMMCFRGGIGSLSKSKSSIETDRELFGFRINELWEEVGDTSYFPYDYNILYTGRPFLIEKIGGRETHQSLFTRMQKDVYEKLQPICDSFTEEHRPKFYTDILSPQEDITHGVYGKMLGSISIEILCTLKEVLGKAYSDQTLQDFLYTLNRFKLANYLTRVSSEEFMKFVNHLESYLDIGNTNIALFPNDSTVSGGCVNIISPLESARKKITEFVTNYKPNNTTDNNVGIVYSSRLDGVETEGIKVEQDLTAGIHSLFSKKSNYKLINWDHSVFLRTYDVATQDLQNDIIVDLIKNKIYVQGRICSSAQLHSQSITCEILSYLIQNKTKTISSKDLSPSSYTKNKNEMITKVINPFIKLIQENFNKQITITCNGTVGNYKMEFDFKELRLGLLKEI